jgi:hypothetical protein
VTSYVIVWGVIEVTGNSIVGYVQFRCYFILYIRESCYLVVIMLIAFEIISIVGFI